MEAKNFADKLNEIADGIDKIAASLPEERETHSSSQLEKSAGNNDDFGYGKLGAKPNKGSDPLLEFCLD